jgi:hypothetical protein
MTCQCGDKSHNIDLLITGAAKSFLSRPDELRQVWKNWSDATHRNHKSPSFLKRVRAKIEALKTGELSGTV